MKKTGLKKGISVAMAAAMAMSMIAMPVSAAIDPNSMSVDYSTTNGTTYTLSIPTKIDLSDTAATQTTKVGLSAVNTLPAEKVQVKIKTGVTDGKVELKRILSDTTLDENTKVVSTVTAKNGTAVSNGFIVAEFQDLDSTTAIDENAGELNFSKISDSQGGTVKAGQYTGTIVFEGAVVNRQIRLAG